jgi:hypothetical protein
VPSERVASIKNGQSCFYHIVLGGSFEQIFRVHQDKFEQDKEGIHAAGETERNRNKVVPVAHYN